LPYRPFYKLGRVLKVDIHQGAALRADRVIVPVRHPVKTARPAAELYLSDVPLFL
jgi:hypothetical protein